MVTGEAVYPRVYHLCQSFSCARYLFELVTYRQTFDFPKIFRSGKFSQTIVKQNSVNFKVHFRSKEAIKGLFASKY